MDTQFFLTFLIFLPHWNMSPNFYLLVHADTHVPVTYTYEAQTFQKVKTGCRGTLFPESKETHQIFYVLDATGVLKYVEPGSPIQIIFPFASDGVNHHPHKRQAVKFSEICFPPQCNAPSCGRIVGPLVSGDPSGYTVVPQNEQSLLLNKKAVLTSQVNTQDDLAQSELPDTEVTAVETNASTVTSSSPSQLSAPASNVNQLNDTFTTLFEPNTANGSITHTQVAHFAMATDSVSDGPVSIAGGAGISVIATPASQPLTSYSAAAETSETNVTVLGISTPYSSSSTVSSSATTAANMGTTAQHPTSITIPTMSIGSAPVNPIWPAWYPFPWTTVTSAAQIPAQDPKLQLDNSRKDIQYYSTLPGSIRGSTHVIYYPSCNKDAYYQPAIVSYCAYPYNAFEVAKMGEQTPKR